MWREYIDNSLLAFFSISLLAPCFEINSSFDYQILALYDKVWRPRPKMKGKTDAQREAAPRWKFTLRLGVMHVDGADYVFNTASGELDELIFGAPLPELPAGPTTLARPDALGAEQGMMAPDAVAMTAAAAGI